MKMTKEHYAKLYRLFEKPFQSDVFRLERYKEAGLSMERYRWDMYHEINAPEFKRELYLYLNDNHIDTALRRITGTSL